jgi:hypothetical protein
MSLHTRDIATNVFPAPALSVRAMAGISVDCRYVFDSSPFRFFLPSFVVPPRHGMTNMISSSNLHRDTKGPVGDPSASSVFVGCVARGLDEFRRDTILQ